ncbi:MAG TPA: hypothetical protein VIK01_00295 [Polyangiaceae bacterium]
MRIPLSACLVLVLSLSGCGGGDANILANAPDAPKQAPNQPPPGAPRLSAAAIARVPAGTFGPYLGMRAEGGLALWASMEAGARTWFARPLSGRGATSGPAVSLGEAPSELGLVSVRPLRDGFALLSTHKTSDGEVVELSVLSATGARIAGPTSLGRTPNSLLWVEAIPNGSGASVLWAASGAGKAEIWTADINQRAELAGSPRLLARDAGAWQAVAFGKGIALAVTHVGKGSGAHGPIELTLLGGAEAAPIVVNSEISADLDLDMAALGEELVLAWSDHRGGENRVFSAAVNGAGKLVASAAPATPPLGEQAVLRVIPPTPGGQRGYLAWEELDAQAPSHRSFQVAELQANGRVSSPRGVFEYWKMDGSMPEIAATSRGVAVLTLAPICERDEPCTTISPIAPEFLELDRNFTVQSNEPLWPASSQSPTNLAWNLTCPNDACFALSAENGVPSAVALTRLEHLSNAYRAPASRVELPPPPRISGDEALAETAPLSQIALTETSAGTLLGWITDFDPTTPWVKLKKPTADGRYEPLRARIDLQGFAASEPFAALSAPENLSLRAHSLGGIALSSNPQQADALVAWAGLDGGQPQVFLTLVDKQGKKTAQRMLTHKTGDLNDIATLQSGADYFVAWVDERSSDPELYATKVNHALNRIAPEQRITQAPGAATDVSLVATKSGALAIWADARESEQAGSADIYATALRGTDAARVAPEAAVQKTRAHSFAPVARAHGAGAVVAWLEAAADNAEGEPAHVSFAQLDEAGRVVGSVESAPLGAGNPVTLGLDCNEQLCHAIIAVDANAHGELYAVSFEAGKASTAVRLRSSMSAPSSVAPIVRGRDVYVADVQQGAAHVRRLRLDW